MSAVVATGFAPTAHASRYLQQLCKHWEHNLKVTFDAGHGTITFPRDARGADWPADGLVTLDARADGLAIRIDASAPGQVEGLKGAVERHVDRFAFREAPLAYRWEAT
ncbi:DUF2218 domain-containing protein [Sphingomonas sp.]|uniref:DUF2218 domain-containing protein n=1 Tax=Sphingomonas sp. TaxID=28214 RepID=UPI001EB19DAE|nr:DUF2218 domain-containing protein [Sphingomonas sp.]MBX3593833.1 DUF2218 domain-containing protein [Sphingomonas sp.]